MQNDNDERKSSPPAVGSRDGERRRARATFVVGVALFALGGVSVAFYPIGILFIVSGVLFSVLGGLTLVFQARGAELRAHHVVTNAVGLAILIVYLVRGFYPSSPVDPLLLVTGIVFLVLGCFPWAYRLPWYMAGAAGGTLTAAALSADVNVPLVMGRAGEISPFFVNTITLTLGVPGVVVLLAGVWKVCGWPSDGLAATDRS